MTLQEILEARRQAATTSEKDAMASALLEWGDEMAEALDSGTIIEGDCAVAQVTSEIKIDGKIRYAILTLELANYSRNDDDQE